MGLGYSVGFRDCSLGFLGWILGLSVRGFPALQPELLPKPSRSPFPGSHGSIVGASNVVADSIGLMALGLGPLLNFMSVSPCVLLSIVLEVGMLSRYPTCHSPSMNPKIELL